MKGARIAADNRSLFRDWGANFAKVILRNIARTAGEPGPESWRDVASIDAIHSNENRCSVSGR